jgi:hypothetical protein
MGAHKKIEGRKPGSPRATGFLRAEPPEVIDSYKTKALKAYKQQLQDAEAKAQTPQPAIPENPEDLDLAELLDSEHKAA